MNYEEDEAKEDALKDTVGSINEDEELDDEQEEFIKTLN